MSNARFITELNVNLASLGLQQEAAPDSAVPKSSRRRLGSQSATTSTSDAYSSATPITPFLGEQDAELQDDDDGSYILSEQSTPSETTNLGRKRTESSGSLYVHTPPCTLIGLPTLQYFSGQRSDVVVESFAKAADFFAALKDAQADVHTSTSWRLNPLLGPSSAVLAQQIKDSKPASASGHPPKLAPVHRIWLLLFGRDASNMKRLEMILTKTSTTGPVLLTSVFDVTAYPPDALQMRSELLASKVKAMIPPSVSTPQGGLTRAFSALSPITNLYSVYGPSLLAASFATAYAELVRTGIPEIPREKEIPGATFKSRKVKLAHLPRSGIPPDFELGQLFIVRQADASDDVKTLARMVKDYKDEVAFAQNGFHSYDNCLKDVGEMIRNGTLYVYVVSSRTIDLLLYAGFLTVGSMTDQTAAITKLYTHPDYRRRNVGEALLRTSTNRLFDDPKMTNLVCMIPDMFESTARIFARVGYRILEKSRWEQTAEGIEDGQKIKRSMVQEIDSHSFLSWERWLEIRFDGVSAGTLWNAST